MPVSLVTKRTQSGLLRHYGGCNKDLTVSQHAECLSTTGRCKFYSKYKGICLKFNALSIPQHFQSDISSDASCDWLAQLGIPAQTAAIGPRAGYRGG